MARLVVRGILPRVAELYCWVWGALAAAPALMLLLLLYLLLRAAILLLLVLLWPV